MRKKVDDNEEFSKGDKKKLDKLIEKSNVDNEEIEQMAEDYIKNELENEQEN